MRVDLGEFRKLIQWMAINVRNFAPKGEDELNEVTMGWAMFLGDLSEDQIRAGIYHGCQTFKQWPSLAEFLEVCKGGSCGSIEDKAEEITTQVMRCLSRGGDPTSSAWVSSAVGQIGYEAIGGHWGWYDIMNGNRRAPHRKEILASVKAMLRMQGREKRESIGPSSAKDILADMVKKEEDKKCLNQRRRSIGPKTTE